MTENKKSVLSAESSYCVHSFRCDQCHLLYYIKLFFDGLEREVNSRSRKTDLLKGVQQRTTQMTEGLEHLPHEEGLSNLGLPGLRKRKLRRDLINITNYHHLNGGESQKKRPSCWCVAIGQGAAA